MHVAMYHPDGTVAICDSFGERKKQLLVSGYFESKYDAELYAREQKKAADAKKAAAIAKKEAEEAQKAEEIKAKQQKKAADAKKAEAVQEQSKADDTKKAS